MAPWNCMKSYPGPPSDEGLALNDASAAANLDFPIEPGFLSHPPCVEPQAMLRRIEENMPWRSTRPGEAERRLAMKVQVEFVL